MTEEKTTHHQPEKIYIIQQNTHSRGVAAVLSFFIPGLGQLYKGQLFNGLAWFCITGVGYFLFIFPGMILHFFCILGALSGNNQQTVEVKSSKD